MTRIKTAICAANPFGKTEGAIPVAPIVIVVDTDTPIAPASKQPFPELNKVNARGERSPITGK